MLSIRLLCALCLTCLVSQAAITEKQAYLFFETDSYILSKACIEQLDALLAEVNPAQDDLEFIVHGHTDYRGSIDYNEILSNQRAEAVRSYLVANGVPKNVVSLHFSGELDPMKPNTSEQNMGLNRRVEVVMTRYHFSDVSELIEALTPEPQTFVVDVEVEQEIMADEETMLFIPELAFIDQEGNTVSGKVEFRITEALKMKQFINNSLTTTSNGHLLESGGMLRLEAYDEKGNLVELDPGRPIEIAMPTMEVKDGMSLFYSEDGTNWNNTGTSVGNVVQVPRPNYPSLASLMMELPEYQPDYKTKPRKPIKPIKLEMPSEPKEEDYIPNTWWYRWFASKRRKKFDRYNYEAALVRYENKLDRFNRRMRTYDVRLRTYESKITTFLDDTYRWEKEQECKRDSFNASPYYLSAIRQRDSLRGLAQEIYGERVKEWEEQKAERAKTRLARMERMEEANRGSISAVDDYVFTVNQLSWINVDRFLKAEMDETITLALNDPDKVEERVYLVFDDVRGMMSMNYDRPKKTYYQNDIPKNVTSRVFAYQVKHGKPAVFMEYVDGRAQIDLEFQTCTFRELKELIDEFG